MKDKNQGSQQVDAEYASFQWTPAGLCSRADIFWSSAHFPQFRYVVIGGARTGSNFHVDPMYTSAWNTLLCGRKKWLLVPPSADGSSAAGGMGSARDRRQEAADSMATKLGKCLCRT